MDKNEFFREATLHVCGNLKIEEALFSALKFLKQIMPVDRMFLQIYDESQKSMRIIANATETERTTFDVSIPLSVEAQTELMQFQKEYKKSESNFTWLFRDAPRKTQLADEIFTFLEATTTSLMVLPLGLLKEKLLGGGSLVLSSEGKKKFNKEHQQLLSLLREPFAIAMSNALKHRNELKLFDRDFFWEVTMRICGNFEIEEGLRSCLEYLSQHIPADSLYLERHAHELDSMHLVARATINECEKMDALIPFNENAKKKMAEFFKIWQEGKLPPVIVINKPNEEPVSRQLLATLGEPPSSVMSLPLVIGEQVVGALVVLAKGENRFTEEHARLYSNLKVPFFVALSNTLKHREIIKLKDMLADDNRYLQRELHRLSGDEIVGANFGLKDVMMKVQQVSSLNSPVLLLGETGVGKDVIANTIHYSSARSKGPFVGVNCGAIPNSLIDSELFGHEKGAFTGALSQKRGRFERANQGTIFLDEIGELPLQAQVRLLRVLQNREIERVGGATTIPLDIRIIAATNRNLEKMVTLHEFREDLWFRLNVFPIWIPPLRDRKEDIPALLQHFISQKVKELNIPSIPTLAIGAIDTLMNYHWPGNVRELENIVERTLILNPAGPLTFESLLPVQNQQKQEQHLEYGETEKLDEVISRHIRRILAKTKGKVHGSDGAAAVLGINPSTLRNRMNKLGIKYGRKNKF